MDILRVYVPIDRRHALLGKHTIAECGHGAALFADLSGFTALTEMLVRDLGPQRGAEELLVFLDQIYDPLVSEVHNYGGSVIGFSGDAITCWFAEDSGAQATACALSMQNTMSAFTSIKTSSGKAVSIGVKVAVSSGIARRFLVGDPEIQVIDVLAGAPLEHLASAEHLASRGEVVLDQATSERLHGNLDILEWRKDETSAERYAVISGLEMATSQQVWPEIQAGELSPGVVRPWLLPAVYERLRSGKGEFLAELRPSVALFLRFGGIDYVNDDSAGAKLDAYIRHVQRVVNRFEGSLIQLTIGDKGSYLFAAFGAPIAHEDDSLRAVSAAFELRRLAPTPEWEGKVQIGISYGRMRTGAYGGTQRRTYGVLGPHTNLAARLMQAARPGQILVSDGVQSAANVSFDWEELPALKLKGFSEPVPVYSLAGVRVHKAIYVQEPRYSLPMIGRQRELAIIESKLQQALQGAGQIVSVVAEAGMGKSRLVAEVIKQASKNFMCGYGGECQSYGTNTSYQMWHNIWRSFFELDPSGTPKQLGRILKEVLSEINPDLVMRLPLLGPAINIPLPENDLTRSMDAKLRKNSLEGLLVECLKARARQDPVLLVLEDTHWMDPLSSELLSAIGRSITDLPVLLVMARRPSAEHEVQDGSLSELSNYTEIQLSEFSQQEAEQLIQIKLERFFDNSASLPTEFVQNIVSRAQGNPFYIEELLNYLKDRAIDPSEIQALTQLELPRSLHSLILTRIDQRSESQKITLKLSSVIGRMFAAAWLWGAYPELGDSENVRNDLSVLNQMELTILDKPEPEATYLFKHIITQEVAYGSLPFATRALLHDQLAQFIERTMPDKLDQYVDFLAFQYEHSDNRPKKREYLHKAGQAAQAKYANQAAISYYRRLIPLLDSLDKVEVMLQLGQVLELVGEWDEAERQYLEGLEIAESAADRKLQASCQIAMGELLRKRGSYQDAFTWMQSAKQGFEAIGDLAGVGRVLHCAGNSHAQQGDYQSAFEAYQESLGIRRQLQDKSNIANLLNNLGILARYKGDHQQARSLYVESLEIRREIGDRWGISSSLNNLGILAMGQEDYELASTYLDEAIAIQRQIGDKYYLANFLNNLGNVLRAQGDYSRADSLYRESLQINRELGAGWQIAYILEDIGTLAALSGQYPRALRLFGAASALREEIGAPLPPNERSKLDQTLETTRRSLEKDEQETYWQSGLNMSLDQALAFALNG